MITWLKRGANRRQSSKYLRCLELGNLSSIFTVTTIPSLLMERKFSNEDTNRCCSIQCVFGLNGNACLELFSYYYVFNALYSHSFKFETQENSGFIKMYDGLERPSNKNGIFILSRFSILMSNHPSQCSIRSVLLIVILVLTSSCTFLLVLLSLGGKGNIKYSSPAGPEITEIGGFTASEQRATGLPRFPKMGCRNVQSHLKIMPTGFPIWNLQPASQCAHKHCIMTFYFKNISTSN